jgi:ATPase subunit of ABC transporter with duplicated ATPase domains
MRSIDGWESICLKTKPSPRVRFIPIATLKDGGSEALVLDAYASIDPRAEPVRVVDKKGYPLSSGEISFLRFCAQASLYVENGSLLLLDEPETHLHPQFISQFVSTLDRLLDLTGSAAIIATHSIYYVREVFREQVTVLRDDDVGFVYAERPTLRTFGADVGAISYFVFGEDDLSRLAQHVEFRLRGTHASWKELYAAYKDELSLELLNAIRASMDAVGKG